MGLKIYAEILLDAVHRMSEGLINVAQGRFISGRGCVDQIFTLRQNDEKTREKKLRVHVGFTDLEKTYAWVNKEPLWQVLRM